MMAFKIVFVGSNPSQRSSSIVPFWYDTKSNKVLQGWLNEVVFASEQPITESLHYLNVSNQPTPGNRPLKISEIRANLDRLNTDININVVPDKIIALGKTAEKALTLLGLEFYAMPHPSGLNRLLNDPKYVEEKIKGLKAYLNPSKIE